MNRTLGLGHPTQRVTTLFVSSNDSEHTALANIFRRSNWNLLSAFNCEEALALLRQEHIPVVICARELSDGNWRSLLDSTVGMSTRPRLIVTSREANEHLWADVLQLGGYDLLTMPWQSREVLRVVSLAWRSWDAAHRVAYTQAKPVRMAVPQPGFGAVAFAG